MKTIQTALLISSLCCAIGAYSQNAPAFGIGTKWTYEIVSTTYPFLRSPLTFEITGQTLWNDTLAYVLEPDGNFIDEYMYVQGDSIYFWDWNASAYQLNFDFSATQSYSTTWQGGCFNGGPFAANIVVDSLREETINGTTLGVQHLHAEGIGIEPLPAKIYKGIGNAYNLRYGLGDDCDHTEYISKLRCFEDGDNSYNFVGYPCDSTFFITSTIELDTADTILIYPNPGDGQFFVKNTDGKSIQYKLYDAAGRTVQAGKLEDDRINIQRSGIYFLLLDVDGILSSHKIVVLH